MALRQHYWNPRTNEACFVDETQLIYAFNERQDAGTWSDLHVHPDWGELLFVATGSIVLCSETGNFLGQGYRATWFPPGVQHEWYLPEASWNRSLFFHASLFEDSPRFRQCHGLEMSPLLRELLFAVDDLKPDFTTEEGKRFALVLRPARKLAALCSCLPSTVWWSCARQPWPHPTRRYAWLIGAAISACPKKPSPACSSGKPGKRSDAGCKSCASNTQ